MAKLTCIWRSEGFFFAAQNDGKILGMFWDLMGFNEVLWGLMGLVTDVRDIIILNGICYGIQ